MATQSLREITSNDFWDQISEQEWQTRVDLAACHRLADLNGFSDIVWNHITARVPDGSGRLLINLSGLRFDEVTASNLVTLDEYGEIVVPPMTPEGETILVDRMNDTGFVIHSAIYAKREDVNCVMHSHSRAGLAISVLEEGFVPVVQDGLMFYNQVSYHEYEGLSLNLDERERLAANLGDNPVMIMRNHGLLTTGATVAQAYVRMYYLEKSCQAQLDTYTTGRKLHLPSEEVCQKAAAQYERSASTGTHEWSALLRKLDQIDPSFKN